VRENERLVLALPKGRLLDEAVPLMRRAGIALEPAFDVDTLSYLIIRVAESFIYSDVITGSEPDVDQAVEVVRVLLHAPPEAAKRGRR